MAIFEYQGYMIKINQLKLLMLQAMTQVLQVFALQLQMVIHLFFHSSFFSLNKFVGRFTFRFLIMAVPDIQSLQIYDGIFGTLQAFLF